MIWKRSTIRSIDYKFPSGMAKLVLDKGEIFVESGYGMNMLMCAFDPEGHGEVDCVIGKEMIYATDEHNILASFYLIENWTGPEIGPNGEVDQDPPTKADVILEVVNGLNDKALYPTDLKEAIIGYVERFGTEPLVLLDRHLCYKILMERDGMTYEDAAEFFEYNVIGAWMGEGTPCFATIASSGEFD
jgi:hypothetical protein